MLYRFLVVDDEYYVRQRVKLCIPWESYGFECVGEAEDASQAMEIFRRERIELIILDISMPGQNGLELIRTLREQGCTAQIVILSGFATFEYARQAMAFGVAHYLLKPIDAEELKKTVLEIRNTLDASHRTMEDQQAFLRAKSVADRSLKQKLFRNILDGYVASEDAVQLGQYGVCPGYSFRLIVLDVHPSTLNSCSFERRRSLRLAAHNAAEEAAQEYSCVCTCTDARGRLILIFSCAGAVAPAQPLIDTLARRIFDSIGTSCTAAYSELFDGQPALLAAAYRDAMRFFVFRSIYGNQADMAHSGVLTKDIRDALQGIRHKLSIALLRGEVQRFAPLLSAWFGIVRREELSLAGLESQLSALLSLAMSYALEHTNGSQQDESLYSASSLLDMGYDLEQIEAHLLQLFLSLADDAKNENGPLIEQAVAQAAELMRSEYSRPEMGLQYLAARLVISPSYLSRNFKRLYGLTLMQYLTQQRMERARALLLLPGSTVAHVAEQVGYQDAFYFSKRYKAYFGISPSQTPDR